MTEMYENNSPTYTTVAKWSGEFKRGPIALEDDHGMVSKQMPSQRKMVASVETFIMNDRRIMIDELVNVKFHMEVFLSVRPSVCPCVCPVVTLSW